MKNKPLKILFDANPLVNGNKSGVGYYTQNLIQALADNYPNDIELIGHYFSFLGRKDSIALPTGANISYVRSRIIPGKILSITRRLGFQLPLELFFKRTGDVAIFTNYFSLPSITKIPRIVTIHDLCYLEAPQYVSEKNRRFIQKFVPSSLKTATKVMTISEATKLAIRKYYSVPESKFVLTYIPPAQKIDSNGFELKDIGIKDDYILFVGTLEPRKNVIGLVKAYALLPKALKNKYQLVLAGGVGWDMEDELEHIRTLQKNGENITILGYISDECKAALYENASLFVLASHYEGFGMPILEAMNYGVPTAVSDIKVFHEVASNASEYFDKDSPESIGETIVSIVGDKFVQEKLILRGREQVDKFSWQEVSQTLYTAIKSLTDKR